MPQNKKSEQGNVFVIILIAVALFGALIFTFTRSGSQGTSTVNKQEAKIIAQEILNYARLVEGAVDRVRRNGCSENEISFENAVVSGYSNPNAPGDNSCNIFEPEGGKVSWQRLDTMTGSSSNWSYYIIQNREFGNNTKDLAMIGPFIEREICTQLNQLLNVDDIPKDDTNAVVTSKFIGSFNPNNNIRNTGSGFFNTRTFCFEGDQSPPGPNTFHFVHTLLLR